MFETFGTDIWIIGGACVSFAGFHYPTRMTLLRLGSGELMVISPIKLTTEVREAVAALGPVAHIVAPNHLHHLFVGDWAQAFPEATVHAAPRLRHKRPDLSFDADLSDAPHPAWAGEVDQVVLANAITTEVVFFHRASGTAIFTDLLQQFDHGWFKGWRGWVARLDLMVAPHPMVPRKYRIGFTKRAAARAAVREILAWPTRAVILAHGTPVRADGLRAVRRAFSWLQV